MTPTRAQIAAEPLLTAEEEVELARRIEAGLLARERWVSLVASSDADPVLVTELRVLEEEGVAARQRFVSANLRLVAMVSGPASRASPRGSTFPSTWT